MKTTAQCHNVQTVDPSVPPAAVIEAIKDSFPKNADDIIASLTYHALGNFWSFNQFGMFIGVEADGYIHS
jgi:hypothetical protein